MVKNVHICDLCGAEYIKPDELAHLEITVANSSMLRFYDVPWSDKHLHLDICKKCLKKKGI